MVVVGSCSTKTRIAGEGWFDLQNSDASSSFGVTVRKISASKLVRTFFPEDGGPETPMITVLRVGEAI